MNNNNIFKEINEKADIVSVAQAYGEKIDRQYRCNCFLHNDKDPSLQLHRETNTWWCYVCGEGYTPIDFVMKKLGLSVFDAAKDINNTLNLGVNVDGFNAENEQLTKVAEYFYRRADESITMKVEKWVKPSTGKKEFYPYALINGKYVKGYATKLEPEDCVLYNLPDVLNSDIVYFTEGEKDADTLKKLGFAGTTTPGGGRGLKSYYKKNKKLFEPIKGKKIRIVSDNDEVGSEYSQQILEAIKDIVSEIKIFNLCKIMPNLKKKGDITDVAMAVGKQKTIEYLETLEKETEPWKEEIVEVVEEEELILETREDIFNVNVFKKLYGYEVEKDIDGFLCLHNKIMEACQKKKLTGFKAAYKQYKEAQNNQFICDSSFITFPGLNQNVYNTNKYEMSPDGIIYEIIPQVGRVLVCYHPIVPVEKYRNIEDGTEKIKIAYYTNYNWNYVVVDKSVISSSQSIIKLADLGVAVTSENAKFLIKYLCEIENLNRDKIATNCSVSRLGWFNERLVPYDDSYQIDNEKDIPNLQEKFGTSGELSDWIEFFRERRKHNNISRIIMASAVASILLKDIKQNGFTLHIWGESEYGKTVACMAAQSIFGNPAQTSGKGIGINFNLTNAGLEYSLNTYNNLPLFINEMQHQKDAVDYDKLLFLISEGKGRTRATKSGGLAKENNWNNVVITNGEKNIIKDNSNAGAYNRCISCEITEYSYENLSEVADFSKENYGTVIREILKNLKKYDIKAIYNEKLAMTEKQLITNKQKILEALIMTGDQILTDIIFKDELYLTLDDFENKTIKKDEVVVEERAYEVVKEWYTSQKRHFVTDGKVQEDELKVEIYGRTMENGFVAIIPGAMKKVLEDNGYDKNEVLNAWKRKGYINCSKGKNTKPVRINGNLLRCIVLDMEKGIDYVEDEEMQQLLLEDMPF